MKKFKILLFLLLTSMLTGNTFASSIERIETIDNNTVQITASNDVVFSDSFVEGDIKILKDINVSFNDKDKNNTRKVLLNLSDGLEANTSYSLITILGANGNIDFNIGDYLEGDIVNPLLEVGDEGIEKISIIDSKTIELYYNYDLADNMFEYKILSDIPTSGLFSEGNNVVELGINGNLEKNSEYILMILSLEDIKGNVLIFDEDLYNFTTSNNLIEDVESKDIVLAAAKEETATGNVEAVALASDETPDTGSATWVLILLTVIVNLGFFLRKKLIK